MVLTWKDNYVEDITVVSLLGGLKIEGRLKIGGGRLKLQDALYILDLLPSYWYFNHPALLHRHVNIQTQTRLLLLSTDEHFTRTTATHIRFNDS